MSDLPPNTFAVFLLVAVCLIDRADPLRMAGVLHGLVHSTSLSNNFSFDFISFLPSGSHAALHRKQVACQILVTQDSFMEN